MDQEDSTSVNNNKLPIPVLMQDITLDWLNAVFIPHQIHVEEFSFEGDAKGDRGCLSSLNRIKMQVRSSEQETDGPREMSIIIKSIPSEPQLRDYTLRTGYCQNELQVYMKLFPALEKFLDSRGVSKENQFAHPKCYYGAEEEGPSNLDYKSILVLEDLIESKFTLWSEGIKNPLGWDYAAAAVRQIALFHAASIAYKASEGFIYFKDEFPCLLVPKLDDPQLDSFLAAGFDVARKVVSTRAKESCESSEEIELEKAVLDQVNFLEKEFKVIIPEVYLNVNLDELNTIRHSDLHINNVHFKLGDDQNVQAKWFDFQACCEGRPMLDLGFFLILCCNVEFSTIGLDKTLSYYYEIFMSAIREAKVELNYSFERLQKDFSENRLPSILHIISGCPNYCKSKSAEERLRTSITYAYKKGELEWPRKKM